MGTQQTGMFNLVIFFYLTLDLPNPGTIQLKNRIVPATPMCMGGTRIRAIRADASVSSRSLCLRCGTLFVGGAGDW